MSDCEQTHNISITRGDSFRFVAGLADGWDFVAADPSGFYARLVFRDVDDDSVPEVFSIISLIYPGTDNNMPSVTSFLEFLATPGETQSLPQYDLLFFCEIVGQDGQYIKRLFNGRVRVGD